MTLNVDEMRSKAQALHDLDAASVAEYVLVWNAYARSVNCVSVLELIDRLKQAEQAVARVRVELGYIPEDFSARILRALDGDQA